MKTLIDLDH